MKWMTSEYPLNSQSHLKPGKDTLFSAFFEKIYLAIFATDLSEYDKTNGVKFYQLYKMIDQGDRKSPSCLATP